MSLTKDDVRWAYKILLGREPDSVELVEHTVNVIPNLKSLRAYLFSIDEFIVKNRDILKRLPATIPGPKETYSINGNPLIDVSTLNEFAISQGIHEKAEIAFIIKRLREGDVFLDVGAGRGIFSVVAASCVGATGRVYTVETDPRCIALINKNAVENEVERRIEIVRAMVTGRSVERGDEAPIAIDAGTNGSAHHGEAAIQDTLDNIFINNKRIKFIRIDQGGAEIFTILGARQIISRDRPLVLSKVEPNRLEQISNKNWQYYFGLMAQHGYKPHILDEDGVGKTHPILEPGQAYSVVFSTTGHYIG